jgi:transposase-like protein
MANSDRSKEDFWRRMIRRQAGSGVSVRDWCRRHSVSEASFYWWRRRLARTGRPARKSGRRKSSTPQFVPVRVTADQAGAANSRLDCIEIVLPGTQRVRVLGAVDRQALADVLAVLDSIGAGSAESASC